MRHSTDPSRDLLFGLLALQNGLIDQGALFAAFASWTRDKSRSLADHLVELGHVDPPRRAVVEAIAGLHVQALGGDPEKSLAVLAVGRSTRASLGRVGGPDLEATLGHVGSAQGSTCDDESDADRTGTYSVGSATSAGQRFHILRPHAKGGLGAVFVALDSELDREVALKQILDDRADDPTSRSRFLIEAQITGGLEHPGIVPVYGLGTYGDGRPYYAMRFIRGDSLKQAIDRFHATPHPAGHTGSRDLGFRKLLRRFIDVCNAIDYAHSRGVLHRDIKPGNIILGKHGETLVVDWGVAKPTGLVVPGSDSGERLLMPSSASGSSETLPGCALGTPAYMSPEQAEGRNDRQGPRSDVYSLGATLYYLLTGKPPFEGPAADVLRAVQRGEFRPPRQLDPGLDPAMEAICLQAMAHRHEDRYPSGRALADDLDRWMADEPVSAWSEPLARRARRWARRNRTAVTAAAVALLAGVVGLSAVLAVQTRAKADLAASLTRETNAKKALADSNAELTHSQAAVQARYDLAVAAIKTFHTGVSEDFLLKQEQFKDVRDRLLKSASDFYGKLGALLGKETDLASRRAVAQASFEVAELTGKVGKLEDALAAHRQVLAAREALAAGSSADAETKTDVGLSLTAVGRLLETTGKTNEAEATYRTAETLLVELATAQAATARIALANCRSSVGRLLQSTGRFDLALSAYRLAREDQEALAAAPEATTLSRGALASTINSIAMLLTATRHSSEAEVEYRKALAIQRKLADDNATDTRCRSDLAISHNNLGHLLAATGKSLEAEAEYREALALEQKLADDNPAVTEFRSNLALSHNGLGYMLSNIGRLSEAENEHRMALEVQRKLADDNPAVTRFRNSLALDHNNLGWLLYQSGKAAEAEVEYHKALAIQQKLADDNPTIPHFQDVLALTLLRIGWQLAQAGKTDEAIRYYTREEAIRLKLAEASSATPDDKDRLANCQTNTADLLRRAGRLDEALAACDRSLVVREPLVKAHPEIPDYRASLGETYLRLGQVRCDLADLAGAAAAWKRALFNYEGSKSLNGEQIFFQACCHAGLAGLGGQAGSGVSAAEGPEQAGNAIAVLRQALSMGYRNPDAYRTESAFDSLRNRHDFRALMMDLMFPADAFAR